MATVMTFISVLISKEAAEFSVDEAAGHLVILPKSFIKKSSVFSITITFVSLLRVSMEEKSTYLNGFYETSYIGRDGEKHNMAVSYFQPARARNAFPCFDDPKFRSVFELTVRSRYPEYFVYFNTGEKTRVKEERTDWLVTSFHPTPRIPVYLVSILVTDMEILAEEVSPITNTLVRIGGESSKWYEAQFALDVAIELVDEFSQMLALNYSEFMPKIDHFALPQFGPGAMENIGIALYRQNYLWFNQHHDNEYQRAKVITSIGHELFHQW